MKKIKRIALIGAAVLFSAAIASCNKGPKPEDRAIEFLNAYLSTDFTKAAEMCTADLSKFLISNALEEVSSLPDSLKSIIKSQIAYYTPQIDSVIRVGKSDTSVVCYTITSNNPADSILINGAEQKIANRLTLVKEEEGWVVAALN